MRTISGIGGSLLRARPVHVAKIRVLLPPILEQRWIAEILDKADALRAKRRAALAQLDAVAQSIFLNMFGDPATNPHGWHVRSLSEMGMEFRYGTSNKSAAAGKWTLRIPNVVGGSIDLKDLKRVPVTDNELDRLRLQRGDLLFVRTNGNPDYVGRCAVYDPDVVRDEGFDGDDFIFASYLIRGRIPHDSMSPVFLREHLATLEGRRRLRARSKTSAGQYNINTEGLGSIHVMMPPTELQRAFGRRLRGAEMVRRRSEIAAAKLDRLFASLQHRAFRGEL
jgi:type I restriction enzyme S subunit